MRPRDVSSRLSHHATVISEALQSALYDDPPDEARVVAGKAALDNLVEAFERRGVWIVSTGSGYYADSVWSTYQLAHGEARRLELDPDEDAERNIKFWHWDTPEQCWAENPYPAEALDGL